MSQAEKSGPALSSTEGALAADRAWAQPVKVTGHGGYRAESQQMMEPSSPSLKPSWLRRQFSPCSGSQCLCLHDAGLRLRKFSSRLKAESKLKTTGYVHTAFSSQNSSFLRTWTEVCAWPGGHTQDALTRVSQVLT